MACVITWRVLFFAWIWFSEQRQEQPWPIWLLRASHIVLSPLLFFALAGYLSQQNVGMGCWASRGVYFTLSLLLLPLALVVALAERTLTVIYVTPVRDIGSQTRMADTLFVSAVRFSDCSRV